LKGFAGNVCRAVGVDVLPVKADKDIVELIDDHDILIAVSLSCSVGFFLA